MELKYLSPYGEEGFQENLSVTVVYWFTILSELKIEYSATTDKPTVINLTHYSFFNLNDFSDGVAKTINTYILQINGSRYATSDDGPIPTGKIDLMKNAPYDFTKPISIGKRVNEPFQFLIYGKGYDHSWILDKKQVK